MRASILVVGGLLWLGAGPAPLPISDVDAEPNDDFAHAAPISVPLVDASGCLEPATDVDFYRFTLADRTPLFVGAKAKGGAQYRIALFNQKQEPVARGGNMLDIPDLAAGTYFVRISGIERDCYDFEVFTETRLPPFG